MSEINKYYVDLDGGNVNNLLNWRHNPLTTSQRTALSNILTSENVGYFVFDTDLLKGFYWTGSTWVGQGGGITSVLWGGITGNILDQTDLQNEFSLKLGGATDGLSVSGNTAILGGVTLTDKIIDMSVNDNNIWFKQGAGIDGTRNVTIGSVYDVPWGGGSGLVISKSINDDAGRCNLLTLTSGDTTVNGFLFLNYQDTPGEILPNLRVASNAPAGQGAAFNLDLAGRDSTNEFSHFSVFYYDYDQYVTNGNQAGPMLNSNLINFTNGTGGALSAQTVHFMWVDKNYNYMIGKNSWTDRPQGALQIGDNAATYGLYQIGAGSSNWLAGNVRIGGPAQVATHRLEVSGTTQITSLAGSGDRMVIADTLGVLSTQAIPAGGVTSFNTRTGDVVLQSSDVTNAVGYTPVDNSFTINTNAPLTGGGQLGYNGETFITLTLDNTQVQVWANSWVYQFFGQFANTVFNGATYKNFTNAANNSQQYSPAILLLGNGWKTNSIASSQPVQFQFFVQPVQGAANPTGLFKLQSSINSVSFTDALSVTNTGKLILPSSTLGTIASGTVETDGTHIYYSTASTRFQLDQQTAGLITGVSSVTNSDGTLTITPTSGAVVASLALGHANTWTAAQTFLLTSLGATPTSNVLLRNTTAATVSLNQISPSILWEGQGWKTAATAGSQPIQYRMYASPTTGVSQPLQNFGLTYSVNASAFQSAFNITYDGSGQVFRVFQHADTTGQYSAVYLTNSGGTQTGGMLGVNQSGEVRFGGFNGGGYFMTLYANNVERARIVASTGNLIINTTTDDTINKLQVNGTVKSTQYRISALNTAPASSTDTGALGEIRITAGFIYVCTATNTWVRTALATF